MKYLAKTILITSIFLLFAAFAAANPTTVEGGDGLQDAINSASPGDIIEINDSEEYDENIVVDVEDLTLKSSEDERPVIGPSSGHNAVKINETGVELKSLAISGRDLDEEGETVQVTAQEARLEDNEIRNGDRGLVLEGDNTTFIENSFTNSNELIWINNDVEGGTFKYNEITRGFQTETITVEDDQASKFSDSQEDDYSFVSFNKNYWERCRDEDLSGICDSEFNYPGTSHIVDANPLADQPENRIPVEDNEISTHSSYPVDVSFIGETLDLLDIPRDTHIFDGEEAEGEIDTEDLEGEGVYEREHQKTGTTDQIELLNPQTFDVAGRTGETSLNEEDITLNTSLNFEETGEFDISIESKDRWEGAEGSLYRMNITGDESPEWIGIDTDTRTQYKPLTFADTSSFRLEEQQKPVIKDFQEQQDNQANITVEGIDQEESVDLLLRREDEYLQQKRTPFLYMPPKIEKTASEGDSVVFENLPDGRYDLTTAPSEEDYVLLEQDPLSSGTISRGEESEETVEVSDKIQELTVEIDGSEENRYAAVAEGENTTFFENSMSPGELNMTLHSEEEKYDVEVVKFSFEEGETSDFQARTYSFEPGEDDSVIHTEFGSRIEVQGEVTAESDEDIQDARVTFRNDTASDFQSSTVDEDGEFKVELINDTFYDVNVRWPNGLDYSEENHLHVNGNSTDQQQISQIELQQGETTDIKVVNSTGGSVDAWLSLRNRDIWFFESERTRDGEPATFKGINDQEEYELVVRPFNRKYEQNTTKIDFSEKDELENTTVQVQETGPVTVEGQVQNQDSEGVEAELNFRLRETRKTIETDEEGSYQVNLTPSSYTVEVSPDNSELGAVRDRVRVPRGHRGELNQDFEVSSLVNISFELEDGQGEDVEGGFISAYSRDVRHHDSGRTNDTGEETLQLQTGADYRIRVSHRDYLNLRETLEVTEEGTASYLLEQGESDLEGNITFENTEGEAEEVSGWISIRGTEEDNQGSREFQRFSDGVYEAEDLATGEHRVRIRSRDRNIETEDTEINLGQGENTENFNLEPVDGRPINITVLDEGDASPLENATVHTSEASSTADGEGLAQLPRHPAGEHTVRIRREGYKGTSTTVDTSLEDSNFGETEIDAVTQEVTLERPEEFHQFELTVKQDGETADATAVAVESASEELSETGSSSLDSSSTGIIEDLQPGEYTVALVVDDETYTETHNFEEEADGDITDIDESGYDLDYEVTAE